MFLCRVNIALFSAEPNVHSGHILKPILLLFGDDKNSLGTAYGFVFLVFLLKNISYYNVCIDNIVYCFSYHFLRHDYFDNKGIFL